MQHSLKLRAQLLVSELRTENSAWLQFHSQPSQLPAGSDLAGSCATQQCVTHVHDSIRSQSRCCHTAARR